MRPLMPKQFTSDIVTNAYQQESQLITQIYRAATEPQSMTRFLESIKNALNCRSASISVMDQTGRSQFNKSMQVNVDPYFSELYNNYYSKINMFGQAISGMMKNKKYLKAIASHEFYPLEKYLKSEIYNEWAKKQDNMCHVATTAFNDSGSIIIFGLQRTEKQGYFHPQELDFLDRLGPHLKNAFNIHQKFSCLEAEKKQLEVGLYHSERPYILFDQNLNVTFVNRKAEAFFRHTKELSVSNRKLKASNPVISSKIYRSLKLAVHSILDKGDISNQLLKVTREGKQDLVLHISPFFLAEEDIGIKNEFHSRAFIEIFDPDCMQTTSEQTLEELYALTPAEAKLAAFLLTGASLKEIEQFTNTTANTLKTHLKAIFRKTDTYRQQELIVKLSNLPRF